MITKSKMSASDHDFDLDSYILSQLDISPKAKIEIKELASELQKKYEQADWKDKKFAEILAEDIIKNEWKDESVD